MTSKQFVAAHIEKIVLAVCVVVLAASAAFFVIIEGKPEEPRLRLGRSIEQVEKEIEKTTLAPLLPPELQSRPSPISPVEDFRATLNDSGSPWPGKEHVAQRIEPEIEYGEMPEVLAVKELELIQGRGVTEDKSQEILQQRIAQGKKTEISDIVWVSGKAKFDLGAQIKLNEEGHTNRPGEALITRIEVRRAMLMPDGKWSSFETIKPAITEITQKALPGLPKDPKNIPAVEAYHDALAKAQSTIYQPPFFALLGKNRHPIDEEIAKPAGEEAPPERPLETNALIPRAAAEARATRGAERYQERFVSPSGPITVWFHDLSVRPGNTYKYKMRVWIFNPIYDHPHPRNPEDKYKVEADSKEESWSATQTITMPPLVEFFFVGSVGERPLIEIHRWIHGQWVFHRALMDLGQQVSTEKSCRFPTPDAKETFDEPVTFDPGIWLVDLIKDIKIPSQDGLVSTSILVWADAPGKVEQRIELNDKEEAQTKREERTRENPQLPKPPEKPEVPEVERPPEERPPVDWFREGQEDTGRSGRPTGTPPPRY